MKDLGKENAAEAANFNPNRSWRCCKCNVENYNDKYVCSYCKHDRCGKCKDIE
jgi:hypothetical protein